MNLKRHHVGGAPHSPQKPTFSRRQFLGTATAAGASLALARVPASAADSPTRATAAPASAPAASSPVGSSWPISDRRDEEALIGVLRSGRWGRTGGGGVRVKEFEEVFAKRMGAKYCVATSSGTTALLSTLGALNVGPGDEVVIPPYTFVATFNAVTASFALPVFADIAPDTFEIDAQRIAAAITPATRLLLPPHIGGSTGELDAIAELAHARGIALVEDACQALTAEWRGKPVGTRGVAGCFSFQASKNLTSGEGGAVLTNDETFANQVFNFHTPGAPRPAPSHGRAANFRLTEFQAGLLLSQYSRFEAQQTTRTENATYLATMLAKIPGITPAKLASGCNRSGWHLFMLRYDAKQFAGLPRAKFFAALAKQGVTASGGYTSLMRAPHVRALATNPHYVRIYGQETMARWIERNPCPETDRLAEEGVWLAQTTLLASRSDMERIAEAFNGVQRRAGELART